MFGRVGRPRTRAPFDYHFKYFGRPLRFEVINRHPESSSYFMIERERLLTLLKDVRRYEYEWRHVYFRDERVLSLDSIEPAQRLTACGKVYADLFCCLAYGRSEEVRVLGLPPAPGQREIS